MAEEEERDILKRHDMTPRAHLHTGIEKSRDEGICGNVSTVRVLVYVCVRVCSYLGEGCYPLGQFSLYLRQRLGLPHGLLELLLCELQPLL